LAGRHEPSSGGSFYLSLATAALRAILVIAALALGIFVLSRAFPSGEEAAPVTPGGAPTTAPPTGTSPAPDATTPEAPPTHQPSEISIQVLNGTDAAGLGQDTAELLEDEGYDVPTIGDAQNKPYEVTEIFFKRRFEADAAVLRDRFFPGAELHNTAPDAAVAITVILGLDYAQGQGESPTP
jgi:hypothetical protein